jgi:hypothetical protein
VTPRSRGRRVACAFPILAALGSCWEQAAIPKAAPSPLSSSARSGSLPSVPCDADPTIDSCPRASQCTGGRCTLTSPLAAGSTHTCVIANEQEIRCWGGNAHGQLGIGHASRQELSSIVPGLRDVVQIAAGGDQTCALRAGGDVVCWGAALPFDRPREDRLTPTPVPGLSKVKSIAIGEVHTCALREDGGVWCWGENGEGQLGNGSRDDGEVPLAVALPWPAAGVAASAFTTCAFSRGGEIACWGLYFDVSSRGLESAILVVPKVVRKVDLVVELAVGSQHICARDASGGVFCWGDNRSGQFVEEHPREGGLTSITSVKDAIALGKPATCALQRGGGITCWSASAQRGPVVMGADALAIGDTHACARLRSSGAVVCWGSNDWGQIGDGTSEPRPLPMAILAPGVPPPSPSENGVGDSCASDGDCAWDDSCAPTRCVDLEHSPVGPTCGARVPVPGPCVCLHHRCLLHPASSPPAPREACHDNCGLDEGGGRCLVGRGTATNPLSLVEGPFCRCDTESRCTFEWVDPIPCRSDNECWLTYGERPARPIRRPRDVRGPFRPCVDGETAPACRNGMCAFGTPFRC